MCTRDLPDMFALSPRACGPWASGIYIRQIPRAHVTTYACISSQRNCVKIFLLGNYENFAHKYLMHENFYAQNFQIYGIHILI